MSYLATLSALALLAAPEAPATSGAGELAKAVAALEVPDFDLAQAALDRALESPGTDRQTLLQIYELRGFLAAALRKSDAALEEFKALLVLAPDYQPTRSYSPRVMTPYLEAKAWVADNGALRFVPLPPSPEKGVITKAGTTVVTDPLKLGRKVRFHTRSAPDKWADDVVDLEHGMAEVRLRITGSGWWAELLGERDVVLSRLASAEAPIVDGKLPAAPPLALKLSKRQWTGVGLGGAAAIAAGAATFFGLTAQAQRDEIAHATKDGAGRIVSMTQAQAYEKTRDARAAAIAADLLWVASAALAGGAGWTFWLDAHGAGVSVKGTLP
jgi:hypothetical protein